MKQEQVSINVKVEAHRAELTLAILSPRNLSLTVSTFLGV